MRQKISVVHKTEHGAKLAVRNTAQGVRAAPCHLCCPVGHQQGCGTALCQNTAAPGTAQRLGQGAEAFAAEGRSCSGQRGPRCCVPQAGGGPAASRLLGTAPHRGARGAGAPGSSSAQLGAGRRSRSCGTRGSPVQHPLPSARLSPRRQPRTAAAAAGRGWRSSLAD